MRDLLLAWGEHPDVVAAGFAHSVYATEHFRHRTVGADERPLVRDLLGARAERLAYAFGAVSRAQLTGADRFGDRRDLDDTDVRDLLVLHAANEIEQLARDDGSPAPSLAYMRAIARDTRRLGPSRLDAIFPEDEPFDRDDEERLATAYRNAFRAMRSEAPAAYREAEATSHADTRGALAAAVERVPVVGEPAILLAYLLVAEEPTRADAYAIAGANRLRRRASAWDKRLALADWLALADGARAIAAQPPEERRVTTHALARRTRGGTDPGMLLAFHRERTPPALPPRFAAYVARVGEPFDGDPLRVFAGLPETAWFARDAHPIVADLEAQHAAIAREFAAIPRDALQREGEPIARDGAWDVFMLWELGRRVDEHCARVPTTSAILDRHATLKAPGGLAYFSRLGPHARVAPHTGVTNLRMRCHLGIEVPPGCSITVAGETRAWRTGACLLFNDFFEHSVRNDSDEERVVLIVDLWHPDLAADEVRLLNGLQRYVARAAERTARYLAMNETLRRRAPAAPNRA